MTVQAQGGVSTSGAEADGAVAQSIGGGGGLFSSNGSSLAALIAGGAGPGSGGAVSVGVQAVQTMGAGAIGAIAQSIGGGGGIAQASGVSASGPVTLGGSGNGDGAAVTVQAQGSVLTSGAEADGAVAQSIGGGGGFYQAFASGGSPLAAVIAGGAGSGSGGAVSVGVQAVQTLGAGAIGVIAQSIGGGGGVAQTSGGSAGATVTLGGTGSGDGAAVTVQTQGGISTSGAEAHGVVAQSIGGGGGLVQALSSGGTPLAVPVAGAAGSGSGGAVTVDVQALVETTGAGAHGVIAQSVAGGGGLVGGGEFATVLPAASGAFAGSAGGAGTAGPVVVNVSANVLALGADSTGIVAASTDGTGRGGPISVTIADVTVLGGIGAGGTPGEGDEPANAVRLIGGSANLLTNNGYIATGTGILGFAATGGLGDDQIDNFGRMDGSIDLAQGKNGIDNKPAAIFNSGSIVWLGPLTAPFDTLTNEGLLSPGGFQNVYTTNVTGNLTQTATGVYGLDLDLEPSNDLINVTGTANMAGNVFVNLVNPLTAPGFAKPGTHTPPILLAAGGVTNSGLTLTAFNTAVIHYSLAYPNPDEIDLKYVIDYSPQGLTQNQHSVGNAINAIQTLQLSPAFRPIASNLFYLPSTATLGSTYDSLSGEGVSAAQQTAFDATELYQSTINTQAQRWISDACGDDATSRTAYDTPSARPGAPAPIAPCANPRTWRIWGTGFGASSNWPGNSTVGSAAATEHTSGFAAGLDYQVNPNVLIGVSAGGGQSSFGVLDRGTWGSVDAWHGSIYGAWRSQMGFYASGILSYSGFENTEQRSASIPSVVLPASNFVGGPYQIPGYAEKPQGRFDSQALSGYGELGYQWKYGALTTTPFAGIGFASLHSSAFTETNQDLPSAIGLTYDSRTIGSLPSYLGLQLESKAPLFNGMELGVWARGAWKHEFETDRSTESAFIAAPGFDFVVQGARPPRDAFVTTIGAKLSLSKNAALFGTFEGQFGSGASSVGGTGGLVVSW